MEPKEKDTPAGVGPGITGASGETIENTGHDQGLGAASATSRRRMTTPQTLITSTKDRVRTGRNAPTTSEPGTRAPTTSTETAGRAASDGRSIGPSFFRKAPPRLVRRTQTGSNAVVPRRTAPA